MNHHSIYDVISVFPVNISKYDILCLKVLFYSL